MQIYAKTKLNTSIIWIFNLEHYFALEKKKSIWYMYQGIRLSLFISLYIICSVSLENFLARS